ncbi:DNA repair protein RecO [Lutibacter sp.]|uniref:DNA repair protein RecO n=1 Tax=Lutibacter sp. TaxID=1925666 RepID=UPI002733E137|nr:DNA repair protein RecO [Lutibacter sp.]MDP3313916.1 DNA repair protein RecO [Lutibacter sp.]
MIETTKAIVIGTIKFGDTSLIATCYTENGGRKSYLLKGIVASKKSKIKIAYFQPLTLLNITANHNNKGLLNSIREVSVLHQYNSVQTHIKKQTIALFLSEILHSAIKEEEQNASLFQYLETSFLWLDSHDNISNFHLLFLLNLTKYLGFYPEIIDANASFFDLVKGTFTNSPSINSIKRENLLVFKRLLGINFDVLHLVDFNANNRQTILTILMQYFELHMEGFRKPKSLDILKSVFS